MPWTHRSIDAGEARVHADDRSFHEKHGMIHVGDRTVHEKDGTFHPGDRTVHQKDGTFHPAIERFIKYMKCSISAIDTSVENMKRSRLATNHSLPTIERFTTDRGRFAKLGQFCREILNDYAAIVQPLHTAQPQPAAHQQYDRTSLAPRCHPPEAELRQPQRAGNTSRQQPTLSIWRFAIPACKRGKDAASMSFRVEPAASRCFQPRCSATRSSGVTGGEGAVNGGRRLAKRTLEGVRNAITLGGLGLVAVFRRQRPRARPAARTSPPSRAGLGLGGARRARQGHPSHRRRFHTKRQKRPMRQPETVAFTLTVIAVAAAPDHERKFELGSDG
jgi:hypothetical protein